jgi:hypothetical protein
MRSLSSGEGDHRGRNKGDRLYYALTPLTLRPRHHIVILAVFTLVLVVFLLVDGLLGLARKGVELGGGAAFTTGITRVGPVLRVSSACWITLLSVSNPRMARKGSAS